MTEEKQALKYVKGRPFVFPTRVTRVVTCSLLFEERGNGGNKVKEKVSHSQCGHSVREESKECSFQSKSLGREESKNREERLRKNGSGNH